MKLQVYRIDTSIAGKLANKFRGPDLPVPRQACILAGLGLPKKFYKAFRDYFTDENFYILNKKTT